MCRYTFFNNFVKLTGYLPQRLVFNIHVLCENRRVQGRCIKGGAIVISNHTSVWDYACLLYVFFSRTLRVWMAELLFKKVPLGLFLRMMGGIYVNRNAPDFAFIPQSERILSKGGVVGIFPESRLPRPGEERPLPFAPSAAFLAISTGAPVIPVYTNGDYFSLRPARVVIGTPLYARELWDEGLSEKENLENISRLLRERIIELGNKLDETVRSPKS